MKKTIFLLTTLSILLLSSKGFAQFDENKLGAWYMYVFNHNFKESQWGIQGDFQYRNWNLGGDLEQLLIRSGLTYRPKKANVLLTLGYGHITSGTFGDSKDTRTESRIYQEALIPNKLGKRITLKHRFRYEQRFVEGQDFRTRYRYNLSATIPLNKLTMEEKTVYLSLYNELFINGERHVGAGNTVEIFDRNRSYIALGYGLKKNLNIQWGFMRQTSNSVSKNQWQLSLHHNF